MSRIRKATLAVAAAACAVAMAAPVAQAATQLNVEFTDIGVTESGETADNIVNVSEPAPNQTRVSDPAGLFLGNQSGAEVTCVQDSPTQATCTRTEPVNLVVYTNWGDDRVTVGPHGADETVNVSLHYGDDWVDTSNGSADNISCGPGMDTAITDEFDTFWPDADTGDCNDVGGGGDGGGDGGGGGDHSGGLPPLGSQPPTPFKAFTVIPVKLKTALKKGLKLTASCEPATQVRADLKVGKRVVSKASGMCKPSGGSLTFKFNRPNRRKFHSVKKLKLKLTVRADGKVVSLLTVTLTNKAIRGCGATVANASC